MRQGLSRRLPKTLTLLSALAVALWVTQAEPASAQQSFSETEIRELFESLQNGTLRPSYASKECHLQLKSDPEGDPTREFMATFLEVPPEYALSAFCDALVLAIKTGDVTLEGLMLLAGQSNDAAMLLEAGRVLRAIFYLHRRTSTASLDRVAPQ